MYTGISDQLKSYIIMYKTGSIIIIKLMCVVYLFNVQYSLLSYLNLLQHV